MGSNAPGRRLVALGSFLAALLPGAADATVVLALDLDAKLARSDAVVHGVVEDVQARRPGGDGPIETTVQIRVLEAFRGPARPQDRFSLQRAGGTVAGVTEWIPGLHRYRPGDEVVVFAERAGAGWVAVGVGIGTYVIERPPGCEPGASDCGWAQFRPNVAQAGPDGRVAAVPPSAVPWPVFRDRLARPEAFAPTPNPSPAPRAK